MQPPWKAFPSYKPSSGQWKVDEGKEYMSNWNEFFSELEKEQQSKYKKENKAPFYWFFFYWHKNVPDMWTIPYLFLLVFSWPFRALHFALAAKK